MPKNKKKLYKLILIVIIVFIIAIVVSFVLYYQNINRMKNISHDEKIEDIAKSDDFQTDQDIQESKEENTQKSESKEDKSNKNIETLWSTTYQGNEVEIQNNNFESLYIKVNGKQVDKLEGVFQNLREEVYCKENDTLRCMLDFYGGSKDKFLYFEISKEGQLVNRNIYETYSYHHNPMATSEYLYIYNNNQLYVINITSGFKQGQDGLYKSEASTSIKIDELDSSLNLINSFELNDDSLLKISTCDTKYKEDFIIEGDTYKLTCVLDDYNGDNLLYNLVLDTVSLTYSANKK